MDPFTLALIGGAIGGLTSKKDPLKGALLGAGAGFTGGSLAAGGGLLGGSSAASTAGLLGTPAASGAGSQAAMLAAQNQGMGAIGQQLTAQAASTASGVPVPFGVNAAAGLEKAGEFIKPIGNAVGTASQVNSMFNQPQAPIQSAGLPNRGGFDSSGLIAANNNQIGLLQQKRNARRTG